MLRGGPLRRRWGWWRDAARAAAPPRRDRRQRQLPSRRGHAGRARRTEAADPGRSRPDDRRRSGSRRTPRPPPPRTTPSGSAGSRSNLVGRIPTLAEAEAFLAAPGPGKRAALVDRLLASADYAEHWADVFLDLFVGRQFRKPRLEKGLDPRAYFVAAFRDNLPYDRLATEMLTFTGELRPNGPGVFLASHLKGTGPEALASATARLFLGVQIQCAQCHDHPYDARYKQEDFYGLVAYFARTRFKQENLATQRPAGGAGGHGGRRRPRGGDGGRATRTSTSSSSTSPRAPRPSRSPA